MVQKEVLEMSLSIPFSSEEYANLAQEVLQVDKELKSSVLKRNIQVNDTNLLVSFSSSDLKVLRVAVNAFLKNTTLVLKTIGQFELK